MIGGYLVDKLLERFSRCVQVDTMAKEDTEDYPSTPGQLELGRMLVDELKELKLKDVTMSEQGIVMATLPGNVPDTPTIAWLAHMDTSPEASGKNVKPIVHKNYDGKDITLPGDKSKVIKVLRNCYDPEIPVNIYELGLIYDIDVDASGAVVIQMTLTSPSCPVAGSLPPEIESRVKSIDDVTSVRVDLVWEPPWTPDRMSEAARLQLGMM